MKRIVKYSLLLVVSIVFIVYAAMQSLTASLATAAVTPPTLPALWTAGGIDPGNAGAGQAARMDSDNLGNIAIVTGPSLAVQLAVRSYTADGTFRWWHGVDPASGTFVGDWVVAAPNGDFLAVGHNLNSNGQSIAITMVRYASDGTLLWRIDLAETLPSVGRLVVDSDGNAYLAFNALGDGQDIQLHKYNPSGGLLWSQVIATDLIANDYAMSLALSPDETDIILTGDVLGGAEWITAAYNADTGALNWLVTANEGVAARDVVVDDTRVYVTGEGNIGIAGFLSVVAYDRITGERLWRTDTKPADATSAIGLRMAIAPDGSLAVTGGAVRGFLDWYTVVFETTGAIRWDTVRDGGLNTDEFPTGLLVLADGTVVVTGPGGPNLPGGYIPGVTVGYDANGVPLWEAFSQQATVWVGSLPNEDICATGGYDALITCWRPSVAEVTPTPTATSTSTPTATPTSTPVPNPQGFSLYIPVVVKP